MALVLFLAAALSALSCLMPRARQPSQWRPRRLPVPARPLQENTRRSLSDSLPPRPGPVEPRPVPGRLPAGAAPQQLASSSWLRNGDMPTQVTSAAAVSGPMPGTVSRRVLVVTLSAKFPNDVAASYGFTAERGGDMSLARLIARPGR